MTAKLHTAEPKTEQKTPKVENAGQRKQLKSKQPEQIPMLCEETPSENNDR